MATASQRAPQVRSASPTSVRTAGPADDAGVRALLRRSVMPGAVRVAFTREPSFALGEGLAGSEDTTVVGERDGRVVAMGRCSVQPLHRNGAADRVAYLGALRFDPDLPQWARFLRDGYAVLGEAAWSAGATGCYTIIADDNLRARRVLEHGGRLGIPRYRALASLTTLVAPIARAARGDETARHSVADAAAAGDVDELTAFLAQHARAAQLSLVWDAQRWEALAAHGIVPADFVVLRRDGRIVAAGAVWDQRPFHQVVVDGYGTGLAALRPLVNGVALLRGRPMLPAAGTVLAQGAVLGACVERVEEWARLWPVLQAAAARRRLSWLAITRERQDDELALLRQLAKPREYRTTLYDVRWKDRPSWGADWDGRPFRPEVGLL